MSLFMCASTLSISTYRSVFAVGCGEYNRTQYGFFLLVRYGSNRLVSSEREVE
jgi:hypothetical protein